MGKEGLLAPEDEEPEDDELEPEDEELEEELGLDPPEDEDPEDDELEEECPDEPPDPLLEVDEPEEPAECEPEDEAPAGGELGEGEPPFDPPPEQPARNAETHTTTQATRVWVFTAIATPYFEVLPEPPRGRP